MGGQPYRCDVCRDDRDRCEACRERRAEANAKRRAMRRKEGLCVMCGKRVVKGFTRCEHHLDQNALHSGKSHARATQLAAAEEAASTKRKKSA